MREILMIVIPSIITAVVGWFIGRRRENVDLCGDRLDDLEKSIKVYNVIIDDMSTKIENLTAHIAKLELKIQELLAENKKLKRYNGL
jgi:lipopolysaccharide biosynthesis regulator YciM